MSSDPLLSAQALENLVLQPWATSLWILCTGEASALFVLNWALYALVVPTLGSLLLMDVHSCLTDDDKEYFRKQREERFGKKLEEVRLRHQNPMASQCGAPLCSKKRWVRSSCVGIAPFACVHRKRVLSPKALLLNLSFYLPRHRTIIFVLVCTPCMRHPSCLCAQKAKFESKSVTQQDKNSNAFCFWNSLSICQGTGQSHFYSCARPV